MARKGKCIFCGKVGKLSDEHLFPEWLQRRLTPDSRTRETPHKSRSTFAGSTAKSWDAAPFTVVVREVCKRCNNGWMSELESAAAPILTPMLAGQSVALGEREQLILARWLVKTTMVYQAATEHQAIKPHQYRYLTMHLRPPPSTQVWIAKRSADDEQGALVQIRTSELRPGPEVGEGGGRRHDAYLSTIAIFQFVGQVFGHDLPFDSPWVRSGVFAPRLQEIWPVTGPVEWPTADLIRSSLGRLAEDTEFEADLRRMFASRGLGLLDGPPR